MRYYRFRVWLPCITSLFFLLSTPIICAAEPFSPIAAIDAEIVEAKKKGLPKREIDSLNHQRDLLLATTDEATMKGLSIGPESQAYLQMAILDSDKGKLDEYKALLKDGNARSSSGVSSDELLTFLRGAKENEKGKPLPPKLNEARVVLREHLDEIGFKGRDLFNPNLSNQEIRNVLSQKEMGVSLGFLHEFPGMADALADFKAGKISKQGLKERIGGNLFHNGPEGGFWKKITQEFLPGAMKNAPDNNTQKLFEGTVFEGDAKGSLQYPSPRTVASAYHTSLDRLSQATGGGQVKIFEEIPFLPPHAGVAEASLENPKNTLNQFDQLAVDIDKIPMTAEQKRTLSHSIKEAKARSEDYITEVSSNIHPIENGVHIDRKDYTQRANETPESFRQRVGDAHSRYIHKVENDREPMSAISINKHCSRILKDL